MAYITNRAAKQHYEILDIFRAGMSLLGTEVKSIRSGRGSLVGAKVLIRGGEIFLVGATIPPHQEKNAPSDYDSGRSRRLLLNKMEIQRLIHTTEARGLTIIPLSIYNTGRKVKIDIAVARKKLGRDKRQEIKRRESERSLHRMQKHFPRN